MWSLQIQYDAACATHDVYHYGLKLVQISVFYAIASFSTSRWDLHAIFGHGDAPAEAGPHKTGLAPPPLLFFFFAYQVVLGGQYLERKLPGGENACSPLSVQQSRSGQPRLAGQDALDLCWPHGGSTGSIPFRPAAGHTNTREGKR